MSSYLRIEAVDGTGVTLVDETQPSTPLDPVVLTGTDWGTPQWEAAFSGPRGTLGRTGLQTQVSDREPVIAVRFYGSSLDDLAERVAAYVRVIEEIRRQGGGRIIRRAHTMDVKATLRITATKGATTAPWTARSETVARRDVTVGFTCAPFWEGEPMDADLAFVTGADPAGWSYHPASPPGTITLTATGLQRTGSNQDLYVFPDTYRTVDHQVTATFAAGGNGSQAYGLVGRWVDQNNHVRGRLIGTTLTVSAIIGGSTVLTGTASVTAPTAGQRFALRLTVHSDGARVDYFADANQVVDAAAPTQTAVTASTGSVGALTPGRPGVLFNSNNQNDQARVTSVQVRPYTVDYTGVLPAVIPLRGVPGDAPAVADMQVTARQAFEFGLLGWQKTPAPGSVNLLDDGEVLGAFPTSKWGLTGPTGLAKVTTGGRSGTDCLQVTFPPNNPAGITRTFAQPGYMKWPYRQRTVECWVMSPSSTAPIRLQAGGQTATGTLSPTWQKLAVTFIDTAGGNITVAIEKTGTSSGVFYVDDVAFYDGPATTLQQPNAAPPPFGVLKAVNVPNAGASPVDGSCYLDPSFLVDGGQGGDLVEVWGRTVVHSSVAAATARLRVRHESGIGDADWAIETGTAGRPIRAPGTTAVKFIRYGTIRLPAGRCYLEPRHSYSSSSPVVATANPTANAAVSGYTGWTNPGNANSLDGNMVTASPAPTVARDWSFAFSIPGGSIIQEIVVILQAASATFPIAAKVGFALLPAGGSWTTGKYYGSPFPGAASVVSSAMADGDPLWGRSAWTPAELNSGLTVRLFGYNTFPGMFSPAIQFDQMQVAVRYETNAPAVESLLLAPSRGRAVTPTGVATTRWAQYPGAEYRKTTRADLSGSSELTSPEASGRQQTPGMGGSLIELPPGDVDALVKVSPAVPDGNDMLVIADPLDVTATAVHFAVTPRWLILPEPR